jgi:two-component system, sensor histidine kinase ChiS
VSSPARVLIVGGKAATALRSRFEKSGYQVILAPDAEAGAAEVRRAAPDAVVVAGSPNLVDLALTRLKEEPALARVPVLGRPSGRRTAKNRLEPDARAGTDEELVQKLEASLKARAQLALEAVARRRSAALLELVHAVSLAVEPEELFSLALPRLQAELSTGQALGLVQDGKPPRARLIDAQGHVTPVELAASPQLARVFKPGAAGTVEGYIAHPLVLEPDHAAALVVKVEGAALSEDDATFVAQFAKGLQGAARNVRTQHALKAQALALETAYLERYQELLEANKRLKELDKWKDELLAVCSHDLRAPLNVVLGHTHLLLDDKRLDENQRGSVDRIQKQGHKILSLVEQLLERGRGNEKLVVELRPIDLSALVKEETQSFEVLARQRGIAMRAETPVSVTVMGDELKLRQVLQNLLTNAFDHAAGITTLVARVQRLSRPGGDVCRVSIQDDGKGIEAAALPRLFDRYQREFQGLGLTICREIVELHGGEIWAEPAPGQGSIFSVTLPTRPESMPRAQGQDRPMVLLVEDDQALSAVCVEALSTHYRVEVAADGYEAVEKARALRPDCVVMDVFMPRRDGLDATSTLSADDETSNVPVLLVSGHPGMPVKLKAMGLNTIDHLAKPFEMSELLTRVDGLLRRKHGSAPGQRRLGNDPETGLYDQLGIVRRLEEEVSRNRRYARPLTLVVMRPNRQPAGRVRQVAAAVRRGLVTPEVVGHLGNGVFALVFPETDEPSSQKKVIELMAQPELAAFHYAWRSADLKEHTASAASALERLLT